MNSFSKAFQIYTQNITLSIQVGDITKIKTDAIVNAAHSKLSCGGGVDGAIHRAAGHELLDECLSIPLNKNGNRCEVGEATITLAYNLPAKYVIHTVAPSFVGSSTTNNGVKKYINVHPETEMQLVSCYIRCMELANKCCVRSIAFPSLGTGGHSFPVEEAAPIAIRSVMRPSILTSLSPTINKVMFVLFSQSDYNEYEKILKSTRQRYIL